MRALVTGASGFVGGYLIRALEREGWETVACGGPSDATMLPLDLCDIDTMRAALDVAQPDVVFHLAAQTAVPDSIAHPLETYDLNAMGTARLLQAVRERDAEQTPARVLLVSSAEVYGPREPGEYPLEERLAPRPANPYAASKAAAEAIALAQVRTFGTHVTIARAFNHIGPGQSERFVVASFAAQLARIAGGGSPHLLVGNLEAERDILDVRDVVEAYVALAKSGASGEIYNVCSGVPRPIRDLLRALILEAHVPVEVREDPERMRPSDVPVFFGNNRKLRERTGWEPKIPLARTLRDIYLDARAMAGGSAPTPSKGPGL